MAGQFGISEYSIRYTWSKQEDIESRTALVSNLTAETLYRTSSGRFLKIEDILYPWIDTMRCTKLTAPPSFAIAKAKQIAVSMNISNNSFKAFWQWFKKFRSQRDLENASAWGGS